MFHHSILLYFILLAFLTTQTFADNSSISITQAYPGVFSQDPNILVTNVTIHGINGFAINKFSDPIRNHYDSRNGKKIRYLIMHYTEVNFTKTVELFTTNFTGNRVSAHYVITEKASNNLTGGKILQVVPDELRAWHAGVSSWETDSNLNYISIGIEHVNLGFSGNDSLPEQNRTYFPYDSDQIRASALMSQDIVRKYNILPQHVLGHEDIAPPRKPDPGPLFPWGIYFHEFGIGAWLDYDEMTKDAIIQKYHPKRPYPTKPDKALLLEILISYGYSQEGTTENDQFIILAFKKHFSANQHPEFCDEIIRENDMFWAWALEAKYITATTLAPPSSTPAPSNTTYYGNGTITSPNYPDLYPSNLNATYLLTAFPGRNIKISFNKIHTEACCDFITIYDGKFIESGKLIKKISGDHSDSVSYKSSGTHMIVTFTSDLVLEEEGFTADFISTLLN